jgi:class 3 adenylate cyclase
MQAFYVGQVDLHDPNYESTKRRIPFYLYPEGSVGSHLRHEEYSVYIYATSEFEARYKTNVPITVSITVASFFLFLIVLVLGYQRFALRRDRKVTGLAAVTGGIVSSLFPSDVRTLLFDHDAGKGGSTSSHSKPVASYFPEATVLYADIVGFTAWSSTRPPEQVFTLLETIYASFDRVAHRLGVYKIETIGDCYVAVTGLPDPQPRHAVIMTEFAIESMQRMKSLVIKLQSKLGKGTEELTMRFGLHSGPVTAGVLRGDRSRFQLFGETVYTASQIEHTGLRDRIHVSSSTADCLTRAKKGRWLIRRHDKILGEGGSELVTYWVERPEYDSESDYSVN